jgi:hypothetical protein
VTEPHDTRERLLLDLAGSAMRYVDTKQFDAYHDLERAANAWRAFHFGDAGGELE